MEFYKSFLILVQELYQKSEPQSTYPNMGAPRKRYLVAATVSLAFAMESFINDFGEQFFEEFDDFEMMPTYKKYLFFPKFARVNAAIIIRKTSNEYRLLRLPFRYRDMFTHHKPSYRQSTSRDETMFNELNHSCLREMYTNAIKILKLINQQFRMFEADNDWLTRYNENL